MSAIAQAQSCEDTGHGTFDGGRFDGELIGDFLVDEPFGDECADFTLARGECVESFAHFLLALAAGGMRNASFKHLSGDSWGEYCVTVGDGVNRVDEVVLGDVLEQEAAGSGVETTKGVIVLVVRGKDENCLLYTSDAADD